MKIHVVVFYYLSQKHKNAFILYLSKWTNKSMLFINWKISVLLDWMIIHTQVSMLSLYLQCDLFGVIGMCGTWGPSLNGLVYSENNKQTLQGVSSSHCVDILRKTDCSNHSLEQKSTSVISPMQTLCFVMAAHWGLKKIFERYNIKSISIANIWIDKW